MFIWDACMRYVFICALKPLQIWKFMWWRPLAAKLLPFEFFFLKQDATCRAESRVKPFVTQTHHHFSNQIEITVYLISTCCKSHLFGFFWWLSEIHTCSIRHNMPDCRIPANLQTWMGPSAVYWFSSCKNATCKDYIIRIYIYIYIDVYVNIWAKYITSHTMF